MKYSKKTISFAIVLITIGVITGLVISSSLNLFTNGHTEDIKISQESIDILTKMNQAMSEVAAAVKPAVVNISSTKTVHMRGMPSPFFDDPFFRQFFGNPFQGRERQRDYKQSGMGSGVIVAKDGYILTNNHVIKDADEIKVRLSDKRVFKGKIIGADQKTDLAVIKIDANDLPVLKFGDSDKLKIGDMVIAVGNPFGLNQTVTTGIISAKGRADVGLADYEDFIQTDAAINPGNSGGALVNIKGELIGINTAILSSSGGYQGIGFAIPTNMAKVVMDSLIKKGKVVRGWLGVSIQPVTADIAKQLGLKNEKGALIADISEDSPAAAAGLQRGDVVIEIDGKEVPDATTLKNIVAAIPPGKDVAMKIFRDGSEKNVKVSIREMTGQTQKMLGQTENQFKGVSVQTLTNDIKRNMGISPKISGVVIVDIAEDSTAAEVFQQGDIIMEINRKKVNDVNDFKTAVAKIRQGEKALVLIYRNGSIVYFSF